MFVPICDVSFTPDFEAQIGSPADQEQHPLPHPPGGKENEGGPERSVVARTLVSCEVTTIVMEPLLFFPRFFSTMIRTSSRAPRPCKRKAGGDGNRGDRPPVARIILLGRRYLLDMMWALSVRLLGNDTSSCLRKGV